jgi:hypothetical protein
MSADVNLRSFGPQDSDTRPDFSGEDFNGAGYSDAIHCSRVDDFYPKFGTVISGDEDAADVNNECCGVGLEAKRWVLGGRLGFTAKGGSIGTTFSGEVEGQGKECDVDLGNWSDQSHKKTTGTFLNLWRADCSPIRVRVLNADEPRIEGGGPYVYVFPSPKLGLLHPFFVWCFMTLRRWGFFR